MKTIKKLLPIAAAVILWSCGSPNSNDSTARADSANAATIDSATTDTAAASVSKEDAKFAVDAASGGMAEVQLGELAQNKGTDPRVKEFGKLMVTDHTRANDELKMLAATKNITLPPAPDNDKQKAAADLSSKSGSDFDKAYIKQMVEDHRKTIDLFEDAQKNAKDADIKAFAVKTLPVLRTHLQHIQSLDKAK
ncbi:hypothetical protein A8C56_13660 [Niabella ginsenosidivorans]|uniref:DUF4142 domain-containing protein n=1 Tax=Niabella ginsenosidivorans TaxID=1176587 RepID=A0A1A9I5A9_9BACT|nr:DUF4142 domain-containing protein [Niabella ginsenosidivorans]ANH81880.1 hypothetical protein A8C56_13660 [Niabella ginsenosidivorans]